MTVSTTTSRIAYTGSGTVGPFAITFPFLANADIKAVKTLIADGTETLLVLTTDYTLTGAGEVSGGELTLVSSLSSSYTISIIRNPVTTQLVEYPANDDFPAASHERALDRLAMICQRVLDLVARSVRQPDGDTADIAVMPAKVSRASKFLAFNSNGDPIAAAGTSANLGPVSAFIDTLLDDANAATARATLGVQENVLTILGDTIVATTAGAQARLAASATVAAHATTCNVWTARETILSGSAVTFTALAAAPYVGAIAWVRMNAAHIFTQGATFTVQGGSTITLASGDWVRIRATTTSTFDVTVFRKSGAPAVPAPTRQVFTSGAAATYTTPTGCIAINVRMVGGGGGGGAATTNSGANGVDTTFSTLTASGGVAGIRGDSTAVGGAGGAAAGGNINIAGGGGGGGSTAGLAAISPAGGIGGSSAFGGAGKGNPAATGGNAAANSGAGGAGGGNSNSNCGGGGGAGGYVEHLIVSPAATYVYTVGTAGAGGAAGTFAGGNGAAGIIIVDEFYA